MQFLKSFCPTLLAFCFTAAFASIASAAPLEDAQAAYDQRDYQTALQLWTPLAEEGNADAQYQLGIMYSWGQGVRKNYMQAVEWFRRSALQGNTRAQRHYEANVKAWQLDMPPSPQAKPGDTTAVAAVSRDQITEKDIQQAAAVEPAAGDTQLAPVVLRMPEQSSVSAEAALDSAAEQAKLGTQYVLGRGVPQNYTRAAYWYRQAALQGNAEAQTELGTLYALGLGVMQNYAEAEKWYKLAAMQGNKKAQNELANFYAQIGQEYASQQPEQEAPSYFADAEDAGQPVINTASAPYYPPLVIEGAEPPESSAQPVVNGQVSLATPQGVDLGVQLSTYKYREVENPGGTFFMKDWGYKVAVEAAVTQGMPDNWFIRADGRFANGAVDYAAVDGTKLYSIPDYTWEFRGVAGKDFIFNDFSLSPYAGYGYRYLFNDASGVSAGGYRRISQYHYIPLGLTHRIRLVDQARLATNIEYDYFITGTQRSINSDWFPGAGDSVNPQHSGKGARGSILYESATGWSAGPWFNYWHIEDSDIDCPANVGGMCFLEPENKTTEVGLKIVKRMW